MLGFKLVKEHLHGPHLSRPCVCESLPNSLFGIGTGGKVEQALVRFSILNDGGCPPFNRKHYRPLSLLELPHEVAGTSPEGCQRLNILADVKHGHELIVAPF
jgi:hypothetical protein